MTNTHRTAATPAASEPAPSDNGRASEPSRGWREFWTRYSPHGELPLSSAAAWAVHLLALGMVALLATSFSLRDREPPAVDVVRVGSGDSAGGGGGNGGMNDDRGTVPVVAAETDSAVARLAQGVESVDVPTIALPEPPRARTTPDPVQAVHEQAEVEKGMRETEVALRDAGKALREILGANQNRSSGGAAAGAGPGQGGGSGGGSGTGRGAGAGPGSGTGGGGRLDVNSTPGRQARWVITYATLPMAEYERMLDFFRIELAYIETDRKTLQYLANVSHAGKRYARSAADEDRMFWYWMGQNHLQDLDEKILLKHGLRPTSEVVQLYPKELENKLADMEKTYLLRQWKTSQLERIAQTDFRILADGPNHWHIEVTDMNLR